jgi:hypothetical protein
MKIAPLLEHADRSLLLLSFLSLQHEEPAGIGRGFIFHLARDDFVGAWIDRSRTAGPGRRNNTCALIN